MSSVEARTLSVPWSMIGKIAGRELRGTEQVAAELGVSPSLVLRLARRHGLGRTLGGKYLFSPADVEVMRRRNRRRGRTPVE